MNKLPGFLAEESLSFNINNLYYAVNQDSIVESSRVVPQAPKRPFECFRKCRDNGGTLGECMLECIVG